MQTSGSLRRENAKPFFRMDGWSEAIPIGHGTDAPPDVDGYRFAPPILRDCMTRRDGGRLEGRGDRPDHHLRGMEPGPPAPVTARPALISGSRIPLW